MYLGIHRVCLDSRNVDPKTYTLPTVMLLQICEAMKYLYRPQDFKSDIYIYIYIYIYYYICIIIYIYIYIYICEMAMIPDHTGSSSSSPARK